jgi:hypothetical protein
MRKLLKVAAAAALSLTMPAAAAAFEGRYQVSGTSPAEGRSYNGIAQVKKTGKTYTVLWKVGDVVYLGTGILTNAVLSVVFQPLNARAAPGIASLRIEDDKVVGGTWSGIGSQDLAEESWTPASALGEHSL